MTIDLAAVNERSIAIVDRLIGECERRLGDAEALETMSITQLQTLTGIVSKMQRSNSTAIRERRALEKDAQAFVEKLTADQKREAVVAFFRSMNHEQRIDMFERLRELVSE